MLKPNTSKPRQPIKSMLAQKRALEAAGWHDDPSVRSHHLDTSTGIRSLLALCSLPATTYAVAQATGINSSYAKRVLAEHPEFLDIRNRLLGSRWGTARYRKETEIMALAECLAPIKLPWPRHIWNLYQRAYAAKPAETNKLCETFAKSIICASRERPMSTRETRNDIFYPDYFAIGMMMLARHPQKHVNHYRHTLPTTRIFDGERYSLIEVSKIDHSPREYVLDMHERIQCADNLTFLSPDVERIVRGYVLDVLRSDNNWLARWDLSDVPASNPSPGLESPDHFVK